MDIFTLWLFNIAMENGPFIEDFPIKTSIYKGFSMAMLNNQMVYIITIWYDNSWIYQDSVSLAIPSFSRHCGIYSVRRGEVLQQLVFFWWRCCGKKEYDPRNMYLK